MKRRAHSVRGSVLLDTVVALAILGIAGSAVLLLASESLSSAHRMWARESEVRDAHRLLSAVSLWPREDLDRHLGDSRQGLLLLVIDRPRDGLYRVQVLDSLGADPVLDTWLWEGATWP